VNTSWKTTLGGAFSAAGSAMVGIGVVPQLAGTPNKVLTYIAMAGFICNVIGTFVSHLFAADTDATNAAISAVQAQTTANSTSILTGSPTPTAMAVQSSAAAVAPKPAMVVPVPPPLAPPHA
jgi:hypothetical protein